MYEVKNLDEFCRDCASFMAGFDEPSALDDVGYTVWQLYIWTHINPDLK